MDLDSDEPPNFCILNDVYQKLDFWVGKPAPSQYQTVVVLQLCCLAMLIAQPKIHKYIVQDVARRTAPVMSDSNMMPKL